MAHAVDLKARPAAASGRGTSVFPGESEHDERDTLPHGSQPPPSSVYVDPVESALVRALEAAAVGGRFDVVAQLAKELEARRLARSGNVVALDAKRGRRGR